MPPATSTSPAGATVYIFTYTCSLNIRRRVPKPGIIAHFSSREEAISRAKAFREEALAMYYSAAKNPVDWRDYWKHEGGNDKRLGEEGWSCEAKKENAYMVCGVWKWGVS